MPDGAPDVGGGTAGASGGARWYRDRRFWRVFLARYLRGIAVANLAWELAQLPLYTVRAEEPPGTVLYAVAHCTAGDVLIAASALLLTMCLAAPRGFPERGLVRVVIVATLVGLAYTAFSEWLNTAVRASWAYARGMRIVLFAGRLTRSRSVSPAKGSNGSATELPPALEKRHAPRSGFDARAARTSFRSGGGPKANAPGLRAT